MSVKYPLPERGGLLEGVASQQIPAPLRLRLTAALRPTEVRRPLKGGKALKAATLGLFEARPREAPLVDQVIDVVDPGPNEGGRLQALNDRRLSPDDLFLDLPWGEDLEKCSGVCRQGRFALHLTPEFFVDFLINPLRLPRYRVSAPDDGYGSDTQFPRTSPTRAHP